MATEGVYHLLVHQLYNFSIVLVANPARTYLQCKHFVLNFVEGDHIYDSFMD